MEIEANGPNDFKARDAASYNDVTTVYDRFSTICTTPLAQRIVSLTSPVVSSQVLDVGTGTGIVALHAASAIQPDGFVVGVDLSEGMLAAARAKAAEAGLSKSVNFLRMDAEELGLPDASFDIVLSLYALTHFPDPLRALREMFRVLRPRGRIAIGVGSGAPMFSLAGWLGRFRRVPMMLSQRVGRLLSAPTHVDMLLDKYFPETTTQVESGWAVAHPNRTGVVPQMVKQAGFVRVRSSWMGRTVTLDTPEDFWELQVTFLSRARKRLAEAPSACVEVLREEFLRTCRAVQSRGGKLVFPYAAFFVTASTP